MDWGRFTLMLYILMRMSGMVLFSPVFGRQGIPALVRSGFILVLTICSFSFTPGAVAVPATLIEFSVRLVLELSLGYALGVVMQLFFYIPQFAGDIIDTQMGMTMSKVYDAGAQVSMSATATLLNVMMFLLFFAANGHLTLLRIILTSGQLVPYGQAALGNEVASKVVELFIHCTLLAVKMSAPVLVAELIGQAGMGILMKVIPQINVFAINIELKVIIGLVLVLLLMLPFSEFLLQAEQQMLFYLQEMLSLAG